SSYNLLQEVDRFSDLDNLLQKDGFRGIYKARTGEACDGCALFWKDKIFTLLHEECIEFRNFGLRDNVAQLCILKINDHQSETDTEIQIPEISARKNRSFVVANIHVLFNPNRGDIKLGQVRLLLQKAYQLSEEWGSIPVIIGGDLNSIPESAMYQFLSSSELDILEHDRRKISGQLGRPAQQKHLRFQIEHVSRWTEEELKLATGRKGVAYLQHQLKLSSAYARLPGSSRTSDTCGEPLATSYHSKFMGTVDYIWHTKELVPLKVLETLPLDVLKRNTGLPSKVHSSHLLL
ncbi:Carbon catabolite repressor protein 4 homolog 5, partial [Linum perenne]